MRTRHAIGTRERIVRATSRLMQRQGYEATGLKEISREAEATLGSLYHFFPGGKKELAAEAVRHGDVEFAEFLRAAFDRVDDPAEAVVVCARELASGLRESGWVEGCPITTAALESAGRVPEVQKAAAAAFENWRSIVRVKLRESGFGEDDAEELAHTVVNTLEGAEMAAQVAQDDAPLHIAGRHLARLIASYR
ncbi:MAG TPA: TetR/AcrR family transcriptional regulator [Thermomonospora sp.]|nr:TetR/AcrR family transcriptional regulator [Thermomonospora sp.]